MRKSNDEESSLKVLAPAGSNKKPSDQENRAQSRLDKKLISLSKESSSSMNSNNPRNVIIEFESKAKTKGHIHQVATIESSKSRHKSWISKHPESTEFKTSTKSERVRNTKQKHEISRSKQTSYRPVQTKSSTRNPLYLYDQLCCNDGSEQHTSYNVKSTLQDHKIVPILKKTPRFSKARDRSIGNAGHRASSEGNPVASTRSARMRIEQRLMNKPSHEVQRYASTLHI